MARMTEYPAGLFSWIDLITPDLSASRRFYSNLFGWTTVANPTDQDSVYVIFQCDGLDVAGMSELEPELRGVGLPASWSSYVTVDDLDKAAARAQDLGARIELQPMRVMNAGSMAILLDPTGAYLSLWQPAEHIGAELVNEPTSLCWNELTTHDTERARRFYGDLFGWSIEVSEGSDGPYWEIASQGRLNGGMLPHREEWGDTPACWTPYISVPDCDATLERCQSLGGSILFPALDIEPGRFAGICDPHGGTLNVMKVNEPE